MKDAVILGSSIKFSSPCSVLIDYFFGYSVALYLLSDVRELRVYEGILQIIVIIILTTVPWEHTIDINISIRSNCQIYTQYAKYHCCSDVKG